MTQINQNFDNTYAMRQAIPAYSHQVAQPKVQIPEYYQVDTTENLNWRDKIKSNPAMMLPYEFFLKWTEYPIATIATWLGLGYGLDKYTHACGGEYEKSLLKKAVNFGDKIEKSDFIQSKPVQSVLSGIGSGYKTFDKFTNKSAIIRAMKDTPSRPEWDAPLSEMITQRQRIVHDFNTINNMLELTTDNVVKLNKLGVTKQEEEMLKKAFNVSNLSQINEAEASVQLQLKRLGLEQTQIDKIRKNSDFGVSETKKQILKVMGKDQEWLKAVREDSVGKYTDEVQAVTKKLGGKVRVGFCKYKPFGINLGLLTKPMERTMGMDEIHNRLASLSESGSKTATGRFMAKSMQLVHRALTFGGGKLGLFLFIAPALVLSAINVRKADNSQKVATGISNFVDHISWVITFPLALKMMHTLGGAQYAGLTKEQVGKCRDIRNAFNDKNKAGKYANDAKQYSKDLTKAKSDIKKITDPVFKKQNIFTKFVRKLARFMTLDLERFDGRNTGNSLMNGFTKIKNLPRNIIGVPMRFIIFGLLSMGLLDSLISKGIKFVFGESYDIAKEEERNEAKKAQKQFLKEDLNRRLYDVQITKQKEEVNNNSPQAQMLTHKARMNQLNPQQAEPKQSFDNYTYIPSQNCTIKKSSEKQSVDNYTYIPSQDSTIKANNENGNASEIRTYIPSQEAANIQKTWDNSGLAAALARADRAENRALRILAGNFDGI